ncbi:MAG: LysR substrate-binding domain-containing protein [Pseudomonadota bacterium]
MQTPWRYLPSPRHLLVFECAARRGSFTRAAQELNVQQPAVSATIKQLEDALGVQLFARRHRQVALTSAGQRLFADTVRAFDHLAQSAQAVRALARADHVTLNASSAFNNHWMMPRLADFQAAHPAVELRLQTSDREPDLDVEMIRLAVRRGQGHWPGCEAALIAPEVIYPVASPAVMAASDLVEVSDLAQARLIHLEEPVRPRPTWRDWFAALGVGAAPPSRGLRLNDYALVLQAAIAGEGFAFGWHHVADPLIAAGLLAGRSDWAWRTGQGFYLVWSDARTLDPDAAAVRDWILAQVAEERGTAA